MIDNIQFSYPTYYLVFALLLALLFAVGLYLRDKKFDSINNWLRPVLSILRFLSVLGILLLLLNPFIKQITETKRDPIIVIAEDRSESIEAVMGAEGVKALNDQIDQLATTVEEKYEVERLYFGELVRNTLVDSFKDQTTNISKLISEIDDAYSDQNLGAIIISSDGIYNEGRNPIYEKTDLRAPIYTIALGDTTIKKDLFVANLLHNRIAYFGDKFSVQVDVQAYNSVGERSQLKLYKRNGDNRQLLKEERVDISNNNFFKTYNFEIEANEPGNVSFEVELNYLEGESARSNNRRRFYMEILDARQKILLLANAPHPDLRYIKTIISGNKNYEVELKYATQELGNLDEKDMVIFHDLPSSKNLVTDVLEQVASKKTPSLFIVGSQTSLPRFNRIQNALKITGNNKNKNEAQAIIENNFKPYIIKDLVKQRLPEFVPLRVPFGEYTPNPKSDILLYQRIGNVDTKFPLVLFHEQNNIKTGVLLGEGIWRWNLFEYAQYEEQEVNAEFFNKMIQYLSTKEDKRKFRAFSSKNNYKENESIFLDAQLYNENFELVNESDALVEIKDSKGKKYNYNFSKSDNYYTLDAGSFAEGNYSYLAKTNFNGKEYTAGGKFVIQSIQKEQFDLTAKHDVLYNLSSRNGAKLYYQNQIGELESNLMSNDIIKPILVFNSVTEKFLNIKYIALIIALLLFLEWFLRRYFGHY